MQRPDQDPKSHIADLAAFIEGSPSPFHAAAMASERLDRIGFIEIEESTSWPPQPGRYFLRRGGALVAWSTADGADPHAGFRIIGAHTDSPNLRLRPRPDHRSAGMAQLGVEI